MDAKFELKDEVADLSDAAIEDFQQKAAEKLAKTTGVDKSAVQAVATPVVKSTVTFAEDLDAAAVKTIMAKVVGTTEDKVNVTASSSNRRLLEGRRLAKAFDVSVQVATTADAKA